MSSFRRLSSKLIGGEDIFFRSVCLPSLALWLSRDTKSGRVEMLLIYLTGCSWVRKLSNCWQVGLSNGCGLRHQFTMCLHLSLTVAFQGSPFTFIHWYTSFMFSPRSKVFPLRNS